MANPGPASTNTVNYPLTNSQQSVILIAMLKGAPVSATGDILMPIATAPIFAFVPTTVVTTNASVSMATATLGIYTLPAQGGTAVLTTAALTGQTTNAFAYVRAATAAAQVSPAVQNSLYLNVGVAVAGGTVDVYLYGYNVS